MTITHDSISYKSLTQTSGHSWTIPEKTKRRYRGFLSLYNAINSIPCNWLPFNRSCSFAHTRFPWVCLIIQLDDIIHEFSNNIKFLLCFMHYKSAVSGHFMRILYNIQPSQYCLSLSLHTISPAVPTLVQYFPSKSLIFSILIEKF